MAQFKQWFEQDFTEKIEIRHCESMMFSGDDQGTIVGVYLYENGVPYSGGGAVSGACDVNYAFKSYPEIMKKYGFNGY
jgi:hypothetical protein